MSQNQVIHRSGPLKQSNKKHKSSSKSGTKNAKGGKVSVKTLSHSQKQELNRADRKHKANQVRKNKRDAVVMKKRGLGGSNAPPILVVLLSINGSADAVQFLESLKSCDDEIIAQCNDYGYCHLSFPRLKQRFTFVIPNYHDIHSVMDLAKVADTLLFIHSHDVYSNYTEKILSLILAHACPSTVHVVQGINSLNPKKKSDLKKEITKRMESRFPGEKLLHADTRQELQLLLRQIGSQKQRAIKFRDIRPHLLAEKMSFDLVDSDARLGTLKVSGYVRGQPLNVHSLIHLPGWGDFQMSEIVHENDPHAYGQKRKRTSTALDEDMIDCNLCVDKADPTFQESLQSEIVPDPLDAEQTWPTEEELQDALKPTKVLKKVVEGTSDYQAAWIVDSDCENSENNSDEDDDESDSESMITAAESLSGDENMESADDEDYTESHEVKTNDSQHDYDKDINMEEERKMLVRFREERVEQLFPDERDTPVDAPARVRYQKYRGLKNFTTAEWDPMENLPPDYARIYRFEDFRLTKKKVLKLEREGALPGQYVTLHIINVPQSLYEGLEKNEPLVVCGLLPHEQKMSVMNVVIKKHPSCKIPIKSKDNLIFHVGFRRFVCQPIFSAHHTGNKFKYERYLPNDSPVVASFYAPVTFPPASVTVLRQDSVTGQHELIATGSVLNVDPNRIIVKRIVLSGHPFKIFSKSAVVRYMFFNKDDINWFKRVELKTKCGRRGHIKEALGSHGHMKCVFDRQLQSQDVILMSLYKRVFPKWTYDSHVLTPLPPNEDLETMF